MLSLSLLTSCAQVPDVKACVEISATRGWCSNTISEQEAFYDGQAWQDIRYQSLIIPASSWGELKAYILKQCKKNQDCLKSLTLWQSRAVNLK